VTLARGSASSTALRPARRRAARNFLTAFVITIGWLGITWGLESPNSVFEASVSTAYLGLALMVLTLVIGPINLLRSRPNPISTYVRRDLGLWAVLLGLLHVWFGIQVHMAGVWTKYFLSPEGPFQIRVDLFGLTNWTGLAATLLLVVLGALSSDRVLARMGTQRWKGWQRSNYLLFVAVFGHGVVYQMLDGRAGNWRVILVMTGVLVVAMQFAGYRAKVKSTD
jgi:methionine sulfoxide reductase heme-binding subunit